jgi:hypothetical protein
LVHDESGVTLVLTLLTLIVLSATTAALLTATAVNHRSALKSAEGDEAFALAQEGLANAQGVLYAAINAHDNCGSACVPEATITSDLGSATFSGSLSGTVWTLTSTGTVDGTSRTVSEQANVPATQTIMDPTIWNYIYVNSTTHQPGSPPSGCPANTNFWLTGGSQIRVPLYAQGNFCLTGGTAFTGSDLEVGGTLTVPDSGTTIGSKASPITKLGATTCTYQKSGSWRTCVAAASAPTSSTVWANTLTNSPGPTLTMPSYDLANLYTTQQATTPTSGCGSLLENETGTNPLPSLNNSNGTVNLFPTNSSYSCTVGGNTMSWNSVGSWSAGTLTIHGSFVVDGSLDLTGGMHVTYRGGGTIFFTGGIKVEGGSSICGGGSGTNNCTGWDPVDWNVASKATQCASSHACNVLILVASCWANSTGSSINTGVSPPCVDFTGGSTVQTGTYSSGNFTLEGGSVDQGPVLADTMAVAGGTGITQTLPFYNLPENTPTQTSTITPSPGAPYNWSG